MTDDTKAEISPTIAAGALVWRESSGTIEVCLVHRPRRGDWTIPKGKLENGESILGCAVREVAEETGQHITLGLPLPSTHYVVDGRPKTVHYWAAEAEPQRLDRAADDEVDEVRFVPADLAADLATYEHDQRLISALAAKSPRELRTTPVVIIRHARAIPRPDWIGDDSLRPLDAIGADQAAKLIDPLNALGVTACLSSPAVRCVDTVRPWALERDVTVELAPSLSESEFTPESLPKITNESRGRSVALCSHRPVLPHLLAEFGLPEGDGLRVGEFVVAHRIDKQVVATERHKT